MFTVKMLKEALLDFPDDNEVLIVYEADDPEDSSTYQIAHIKGKKDEQQTYITLREY